MSERPDQAAQHVLEAASHEASRLGHDAISTEDLLIALATADGVTGGLLAEVGAGGAELSRAIADTRGLRHDLPRDHHTLLATLGIDLDEVRRRAEETFGANAVERAAWRVRPSRRHRPFWTWISCSKPLPKRRCDSPLAGGRLGTIPRVKRVVERATRAARPGPASSSHLLLALLTGKEPACELLDALGVDVDALIGATRRSIDEAGHAGKRAS